MTKIIVIALIANTITHIVSYIQLSKVKAPNAMGVLAFVFINAIIALLIWQGFAWSKWLAVIFPLIGGTALFITSIAKGNGQWVDYVIFALDMAIVALALIIIL